VDSKDTRTTLVEDGTLLSGVCPVFTAGHVAGENTTVDEKSSSSPVGLDAGHSDVVVSSALSSVDLRMNPGAVASSSGADDRRTVRSSLNCPAASVVYAVLNSPACDRPESAIVAPATGRSVSPDRSDTTVPAEIAGVPPGASGTGAVGVDPDPPQAHVRIEAAKTHCFTGKRIETTTGNDFQATVEAPVVC
jgi:hypothetical protein